MNKFKQSDELSAFEQIIISEIEKEYIPVVSESEILSVCKTASSYYSEKQNIFDMKFRKVVFSCISAQSVFFWLLSAFLLGCCVALSTASAGYGIEPVALICALAPVPVISFAINELQYRDSSLTALEKTCTYAPQKVYFSRLWLSMLVNAVWVLLTGALVFYKYENYIRLYFCSFIAMFLIGAVALILMSVSDSTLPLSLMMATWVLSAMFLLSSEEFTHIIATISVWLLATITFFSIFLFAAATVKTTARLYA